MLQRLRPGTNDYDRVADEDNLRRALRWTLSNTDRHYRHYFRETYSAFASIQDELVEDLRASLKRGEFVAQSATKLFTPKASGVLRPMSLLRFEDQVVYQACANLIAERLHHRVRHRYMRSVFGHLYAGATSPYFYRSWRRGYRAFTGALRASFAEGYEFAASFDLTAFYDSIDHRVLCHFLNRSGIDDDLCAFLRDKLLATWTSTDHQLQLLHGHGIPQGPQPSGLIAETVLQHLDDTLEKQKAVRYVRYVDDIRLLAGC
jgi:Reverse transcriptase (RNA-dependent DNA polymerase)